MSTRMVVDGRSQLQEVRQREFPEMPQAVKIIAKIISYLFHPVFVPVFVVVFMVYMHPYLFASFNNWDKTKAMLQSVLMFSFFPIITVLLLKALNFIDSIHLYTQKDRIIPLIGCGIWYFWIWNVWNNLSDYPKETRLFALAIFISSWLALMANIVIKVSLHAIALGVGLAFIILMGTAHDLNFAAYITAALFVTGLVCTARLIDSDHNNLEIYGGLGIGILTQCVVWWLG